MEQANHNNKDVEAVREPPAVHNESIDIDQSLSVVRSETKQETVLDWENPEDSGNPHLWSFGKRAFHTAVPALYGFVL